MSQRLFSVPKVGLFLDGYAPGIEKRRDEEVSVIRLTLRVQPFDAKLASAIDDGLGDDSGVRAALFNLNHPEPKPHVERVNMSLDCPRQQLAIYAAPDAKDARLALNQAKITGVYARTQKDVAGYAFVFQAAVGPVGRDELEFVHAWFRTQRFVTFHEAEPGLGLDDNDDPDDEGNLPAPSARPAPMWDNEDPNSAAPDGGTNLIQCIAGGKGTAGHVWSSQDPNALCQCGARRYREPEEARAVKPRGSKKAAKKIDHDRERAAQAEAGKKRSKAKAPHTPARKR